MGNGFKALMMSVLLTASVGAKAVIIDFESLRSEGTGAIGLQSYSEDGFIFSGPEWSENRFASIQTGNADWYAGSTGLLGNTPGWATILSSEIGLAFDLYAIDLSPLSPAYYGGGATVEFIGNLVGGGTVTQTFTIGRLLAFEAFFFTGFSNLTSVSWKQMDPFHQFDNICVDDSACQRQAVHEPGTVALLGVGLVGLGVSRRRKAA